MKAYIKWMSGALAVLLAFLVVYLKLNPPLVSEGQGYIVKDPGVVTVELQNEGIHKVNLTGIVVNDGNRPEMVRMGVSRTSALIGIFAVEEEMEGVSFHSIDAYAIEPVLSREEVIQLEDVNDRSTIRHYGVVVRHDERIDSVRVKYTYFGIPFVKEIKIERLE
ncbi:hypothetical protein LCM10_13075 [Rossellomorea aquimaris]|uniref:hypothetical protein n=1 Tax=Rossellomorea aquimaris TaxID=189382 RepID=UPI001CD6E080|nr:hypothetical protein [Rossellomorea aquimaris]MCA1055923.1 hypothetical protein [Rossellomorea aquimaris]